MTRKPATAAGYPSEFVDAVQSTCLYLATKLGDLDDDLVVVGGLVPTLLIPPQQLPARAPQHVGTMDLDLGLEPAILDGARYRALVEQLEDAGFRPNRNENNNVQLQTWRIEGTRTITIDFLMPPFTPEARPGKIFPLQGEKLGAFVTPGLDLAFRDRERITLSGQTIRAEKATRGIWVCGPGAFVVLKALAFRQRGLNKDAYDLFYLTRYYGAGIGDVASRLRPLQDSEHCLQALKIIEQDFLDAEALGPCRAAEFLTGGRDQNIQSDAAAVLSELLRLVAE